MNVRWYDRILISACGLVLIALAVGIACAGTGLWVLPPPLTVDVWAGSGWQVTPLFVLAAALVALWGAHLLVRPFRREQKRESGPSGRYFRVGGAEGGLSISVQALDSLVQKCVRAREEIVQASIRIGGQDDTVRVTLRVVLREGVRIPEFVASVQKQITEYVESCAGVRVGAVQVIIESTKEEPAPRLPRPAPLFLGQRADKPAPEAPPPEVAVPDTMERELDQILREEAMLDEIPEDESPAGDADFAADESFEDESPEDELPEDADSPLPPSARRDEADDAPEGVVPEIDFGPVEPLPVTLSRDAFPFPGEKEASPDA